MDGGERLNVVEWMQEAPRPIRSLLIANRGEIACRIIRALDDLGIRSIAIHSAADDGAMHVQMASQAIRLDGDSLQETYLNGDRIIDIAKTSGADAIHPGYGFLSERSGFAAAVVAAGLIWVGPSVGAIDTMGDKIAARRAMLAAGVPVIPGEEVAIGDDDEIIESLVEAAGSIGYPLLLKASAGGGGKGMRIVREPKNLQQEFAAASREAVTAFGDGTVYIERLLEKSRHIEVQVLADSYGNVVHLFERECSIQRRHQKVIEEAPSPVLTKTQRDAMGDAATLAASAVSYEGAGTVEFLLGQNGEFHFLEMNTRLQVEHPITEMISGIDLVEQQIRVAAGLPLPFCQDDLTIRGHAIEARIYAEDPANGFLPAIGPLAVFRPPEGPGVRLDTGVREGDEASIDFDPLLAKLIVHASDRDAAIRRMHRALSEFVILGATTNIGFLRNLVTHSAFREGDTTTDFIETHFDSGRPISTSLSDSETKEIAGKSLTGSIPAILASAAESFGLHRTRAAASAGAFGDAAGEAGRGGPNDPFQSLTRRYP
jgi:acetyl-CoA carboxylase biotin carboxylase subunit